MRMTVVMISKCSIELRLVMLRNCGVIFSSAIEINHTMKDAAQFCTLLGSAEKNKNKTFLLVKHLAND